MTDGTPERPHPVQGDLQNLPPALAPLVAKPNWVNWKYELNNEHKWTKVPHQPSGAPASSTNPQTWSSYAAVISTRNGFDGIGYCLYDGEIAALDLDHCLDRDTGRVHPWFRNVVDRAASYTEITPGGDGLRIIGFATGPKIDKRKTFADGTKCEIYRKPARYITVTGNHLDGTPLHLANIDAVIDELYAEAFW
jgi:primase-polymerase (primpol)-like protein